MKLESILLYRVLFLHDNEFNRNSIKALVRLKDEIDPLLFKECVHKTMSRYPYYCVTLGHTDNEYYFKENLEPIVVLNSLESPTFNSEETNYHFVSFGYQDDWIVMNMFHGLTDGTGTYEVLKTLLYYYCGKKYDIHEEALHVHLVEEPISPKELFDPYKNLEIKPLPTKEVPTPAIDIHEIISEDDNTPTVYHLSIPEESFMDFCHEHDSTPGTLVCLLLSRVIHKFFPTSNEAIRFLLCTNDRKFLNADQSYMNLVGTIALDFKSQMRNWPLTRQATAYRGMVFAQTTEENTLNNAIQTKLLCETIKNLPSDKERHHFVNDAINGIAHTICGMVSYVGKTSFPNANDYITDFQVLAGGAVNLGVQISIANHQFKLDFIQSFKNPIYVNAFIEELEELCIPSTRDEGSIIQISKVNLPWLND